MLWTPDTPAVLGVNLDDLLVSQPDSGEEALTICETLARSGALDVIVVDSVAALVPKAELEGDMGMATMGMQARLMSQALRKLTRSSIKPKRPVYSPIQLREKVGVMFGSPETTPGGKALKFYASVRIDIRRKETLKDASGAAVGNHVKVKIVKNRWHLPLRKLNLILFTTRGSIAKAVYSMWLNPYGVVQKRGAWIQYDGELVGQGKEAARAALAENPELTEKIIQDIMRKRNPEPSESEDAAADTPGGIQKPDRVKESFMVSRPSS